MPVRPHSRAMQVLASSCLDERTLNELVIGRLSGDRLSAAEAHLSHCSDCVQVAAELARHTETAPSSGVAPRRDAVVTHTATAPAGSPAPRDFPPTGSLIGDRYRVDRPIGRGGMGSVVAATHVELEQKVAIKLLRLLGPDAAARFTREGRTLAQLCSQHIVRVYDSGRLPDGTPYIVMEQLQGSDLSELIGERPLPIRDVVGWMRQACLALETAHTAGIIHRDLKPSNLFLTRESGTPTIKVLDFGISKSIQVQTDASLTLTGTGDVIGSPRYMSPEQLNGSRTLDRRTDIWSLGVILYELLTGQAPFEQHAFAAIAIAIATSPVPAPRALRPDIPAALEAIIMRCLAKQPEERFASAAELSAALEPYERELAPLRAAPPAPAQRSRRLWALLAIPLLMAVASLFWLSTRSRRPEPNRPAAASAVEPPAAAASPVPPAPPPSAAEPPPPPPEQAAEPAPARPKPPAATPSARKPRPPATPLPEPTPPPERPKLNGLSATPD